MKDWAEVVAIVASFLTFCVVASYLLMNLIIEFGKTFPPPPAW